MKKIDFSVQIKDGYDRGVVTQDGSPVDYTGLMIDALSQEQNSGITARKTMSMIKELNKNKKLILDDSDTQDLERFIENTQQFTPLVKGRLLEIIEAAEDE